MMLTDIRDIRAWLDEMKIENYRITSDINGDNCYVDVDGDVELINRNLTEIPVQFNIISGLFNVGHNKLTSLKGCPSIVGTHFVIGGNRLTSFEHAPKVICGNLNLIGNLNFTAALGVFQIQGIDRIWGFLGNVCDILERHLKTGDMFTCQQELIDAGFPEYAHL